jgi:O-methyltransferase
MKLPDIDPEFILQIYNRNRSMMSFDKILNLYYQIIDLIKRKIPGSFLELGSYKGYSAILIQKILSSLEDKRRLIIFDSFQGLPKKDPKDLLDEDSTNNQKIFLDNRRINQGWFKSSKEVLLENFKLFGVLPPKIIEGWFEDTLPTQLPEKIAFVHLDGDFYTSTKVALENIFPKLVNQGVILIDDYTETDNTLPGVKIACDEYLKDKKSRVKVLPTLGKNYQAVLIKNENSF